ncbi:MAG: hypothetical protein F4118_02540 [Acidimicrobiaceae bacterium]|nr:hypothetical protein [Acidimicrobiaceae bacterium]
MVTVTASPAGSAAASSASAAGSAAGSGSGSAAGSGSGSAAESLADAEPVPSASSSPPHALAANARTASTPSSFSHRCFFIGLVSFPLVGINRD